MMVKVLKQIKSSWRWVVEYVGGSVYPVNNLTKGQKLFVQSESVGPAHIGDSISVRDDEVMILREDGSHGGLFVILPRTEMLLPFTERERSLNYPSLCEEKGVDPEAILRQISQETKSITGEAK